MNETNEITAEKSPGTTPVAIDRDIHRELKVLAAQQSKTLRELIAPALRALLQPATEVAAK